MTKRGKLFGGPKEPNEILFSNVTNSNTSHSFSIHCLVPLGQFIHEVIFKSRDLKCGVTFRLRSSLGAKEVSSRCYFLLSDLFYEICTAEATLHETMMEYSTWKQ